jgi:hypothetical protein
MESLGTLEKVAFVVFCLIYILLGEFYWFIKALQNFPSKILKAKNISYL